MTISTLRHNLGLTQQQVADRAGIYIRMYQRIESGERSISRASAAVAIAIAHALNVTVEELINTTK